MSQVTLPSSWALLLGACAERWGPSCSFFPSSFGQPEMPPDAGHDGRESAPATIPVCYVFPAPKPPCPAFARRGNGRQDRLEANAAGGTPAPASHARMTMTVTGLPSRRQESRASPCPLRRPFHFPVARCAIPRTSSFSFPPLQGYGQCSHAAIPDGIRCHFRCRGKGKDGIRNTNFLATISTLRRLR